MGEVEHEYLTAEAIFIPGAPQDIGVWYPTPGDRSVEKLHPAAGRVALASLLKKAAAV
jgi:streptogramin lyase